MNKKVLLISDEVYSEIKNGGAESNNNELTKIAKGKNFADLFSFDVTKEVKK